MIRCVAYSVLLAFSSGCQTTRVLYRDDDSAQHSFSDLIQRSPYIVVAVVEGPKIKSGPPGLFPRANQPPFPAQKYQFTLKIQRSLRGELGAGEAVSVLGYQGENKVLIGSPQGISGQPGERAVYFLKKVGDTFRVMEDHFETRVVLDSQTDLDAANREDDIALAIWRLMVTPLQAGAKPTINAQLLDIAAVTREALGRAEFIELLSAAMGHSSSRDFQFEACLWLNTVESGLGSGNCASRLLNEAWLSEQRRAELSEALGQLPEANARMRSILRTQDVGQITRLENTQSPTKTREFLCLLTRHTDREIAELASKALVAHYGGGSVCSTSR